MVKATGWCFLTENFTANVENIALSPDGGIWMEAKGVSLRPADQDHSASY